MHKVALVAACLVCAGHGWQEESLLANSQRSSDARLKSSALAESRGLVTPGDATPSLQAQELAMFLVALNPATAAFRVASSARPMLAGSHAAVPKLGPQILGCSRSLPPWMVASDEVFKKYYSQAPMVSKYMAMCPKVVIPGVLVASGVAGYIYTRSRRIWVKLIGGWLASRLGAPVSKYLSNSRRKAALPTVARVLSKGLEMEEDALKQIASSCGVPLAEFQTQLGELFLTFFNACLDENTIETRELSELLKVKQVLKLSSEQVGDQIFKAANMVFTRMEAYLEQKQTTESEHLLTKFIFLADRILANDPDSYASEVQRVQNLFGIASSEWQFSVEKAALPFYDKALKAALIDGKPAAAWQFKKMREALGISDELGQEIAMQAVRSSSMSAVDETGKMTQEGKERAAQLEDLLGGKPEGAMFGGKPEGPMF